ncbi:MAG: hypothetical protein ACXWMG_01935 [Candidatus Limnocylindria bacterium]
MGVPLALVGLAYALWWVSDRLVQIGPVDRAAFGWAVVIPVWLAAPAAAAFAWRRLSSEDAVVASVAVAVLIGGAAAIVFWLSVSNPECEFGAIRTPMEWVLPSLVLGAVIGGGVAFSALVASRFGQAARPWWGALLGAGTEAAMLFVAILVAGALLLGPGCQRPPI